jgi:hypothetical protein
MIGAHGIGGACKPVSAQEGRELALDAPASAGPGAASRSDLIFPVCPNKKGREIGVDKNNIDL